MKMKLSRCLRPQAPSFLPLSLCDVIELSDTKGGKAIRIEWFSSPKKNEREINERTMLNIYDRVWIIVQGKADGTE